MTMDDASSSTHRLDDKFIARAAARSTMDKSRELGSYPQA